MTLDLKGKVHAQQFVVGVNAGVLLGVLLIRAWWLVAITTLLLVWGIWLLVKMRRLWKGGS